MAWRPGLAPPSTSSTAGWSATPGMAGRANRLATGLSITSSSPGISTSTIRKRNWAALSRRSSVQVTGRTGECEGDDQYSALQEVLGPCPYTGTKTGPIHSPASSSTTRLPTAPWLTGSISTVWRRISRLKLGTRILLLESFNLPILVWHRLFHRHTTTSVFVFPLKLVTPRLMIC